MRQMFDAVTPGNIPTSAVMVAGYLDGRYAWSAADWARFPNAVKVDIAVFPSTNAGHVLDVETGDATPAQAPAWVVKRRAAGVDPTIYCNTATWPAVRAAFAANGVAEPHYWIAAYPGIGPALYAGSIAHQYADPGPVDISVVADFWPGIDAAPVVHQVVPAPPSRSDTRPPISPPIGGLNVRTIDLRIATSAHPVTSAMAPGLIPLQRLLGITADGVGGDHTRWALGDQQRVHGVAVDFIFGPMTASAFLSK